MKDSVLDGAMLRSCYGGFPTGVVATGAIVDDRPVGMAVSAFLPISLDPPLVGLSLQRSSATWPLLRDGANCIGLSFLNAGHIAEVAALSAKDGDRFRDIAFDVRPSGAVVLRDAVGWLEVSIDDVIGIGDHELAVLRVLEVGVPSGTQRPMVYFASAFHHLKHE